MGGWLDRSISNEFNEVVLYNPPRLPPVNLLMFQNPTETSSHGYMYNKQNSGYDTYFYRQAPEDAKTGDGLNYGRKLDPIPRRYQEDGETIYFDSGKHNINPSLSYGTTETNTSKLDELAAYLKRPENKYVKVTITGHTDTVGSSADNDVLSDNRAQSVLNYLLSKGVSARQLERVLAEDDRRERLADEISGLSNPGSAGGYRVQGQGENHLAEETPDETDELANRRVEVELVYNDPLMRPQLVHNIQVTNTSIREYPFGSTYVWNRGDAYIPGRIQFSVDQDAVNDDGPIRYTYGGGKGDLALQAFYITANAQGGQASFSLDPSSRELTMQVNGKDIAIFKLNVPPEDLKAANLNLGINTLKPDGTTQFTPVTLSNTLSSNVRIPTGVTMNNSRAPSPGNH